MEEASVSDLKRASRQGTILSITYNGVVYGGTNDYSGYFAYQSMGLVLVAVMVVAVLIGRRHQRRIIVVSDGSTTDQPPLDQPLQQP